MILHLKLWISSIFKHYALMFSFIRQDINARFIGSIGGMIWTILTPLANILIYIFVFSVIMKIRIQTAETGTDEFVIYLLTGLLPWLAFAEAINQSTTLLLNKANLITKVSFPVEILPIVGSLVSFILGGIGFVIFLLYLAFAGYLHLTWLLLPIVVILHLMFTIGLVALISAIGVFVRDIQHVVTMLVTIWFYLTPILYPLSLVPELYQKLVIYNPMYIFIDLYRQILLQHTLPIDLFGIVIFLACFIFALGGWFFMKIKHSFGDVL
jgi:lipopolysaccharide transport system permease protein